MYVTATRQMGLAEIENLTLKELRDLYFERVVDWVIGPMKVLARSEHCGFAIVELYFSLQKLLGEAVYIPVSFDTPLLLDDGLVVDGDFPDTLSITWLENGDIEFVKINPFKLVESAERAVQAIKSLGDLAPIDLLNFKEVLCEKARKHGEPCSP